MMVNLRQNISERELSQKQLLEAYGKLKEAQNQLLQSEKMASIGQLAAGVAHEINNPLGFIINNVEILQQYLDHYTKITRMMGNLQKGMEEENMEKARSIVKEFTQLEQEIDLNYIINDTGTLLQHTQRGLERVHKIVIDLRTFAREGSDVMEETKVENIIDSILDIVQNELKYKAELRKDYGNTPLIKCSPQRLGQVFINFLVNSAQAIKDKGIITVKTYTQNGYVCVDVSDTGEGIPAEDLKKVFDPFFTTKPVGQGTGLGLSVSYEIIMKHKGEIKVRSEVGQGTTFTVMLPVAS
jgi:signal transduction histidine kinase